MARIAVVLPGSGFGGAEVHSVMLAASLVADGHAVTVCGAASSMPPAMLAKVAAAKAQHLILRLDGDRDRDPAVGRMMQRDNFAAAIEGHGFQFVVVASPWPDMGLGVAEAAARAGVPCLTIFHLFRRGSSMPPAFAAVIARLRRAGQRFIAISDEVSDVVAAAAGISRDLVPVIPNGVAVPEHLLPGKEDRSSAGTALRARLGLGPDEFIVANVARIDKQKGFEVFAAVVKEAVRRNPLLHFVWIGDGKEEAAFRDVLRKLGVASWVSITGWQDDVFSMLAGADLFLQTSHYEGAPLSLLEAARLALPIVTTSNGPLPWPHLKDGKHVRAHRSDDVTGLADSVLRIASDCAIRELMSANLAAVNEALSDHAMGKQYLAVIAAMLAERALANEGAVAVVAARSRILLVLRSSEDAVLAAESVKAALLHGSSQVCVVLPLSLAHFLNKISDPRLLVLGYPPGEFVRVVDALRNWLSVGEDLILLAGLQNASASHAAIARLSIEPGHLSAAITVAGLAAGETQERVFVPVRDAVSAGRLYANSLRFGLAASSTRLATRLAAFCTASPPSSVEELLLGVLFAEQAIRLAETGAERIVQQNSVWTTLNPVSTAQIIALLQTLELDVGTPTSMQRTARTFVQAVCEAISVQAITPTMLAAGQLAAVDVAQMIFDEGASVAGDSVSWGALAGDRQDAPNQFALRAIENLTRGDYLSAQVHLRQVRVGQAPTTPGRQAAIITCRRVPFPPRMGSDSRMVTMGRMLRDQGFDVLFSCEVKQKQIAEAQRKAIDLRNTEGFAVDLAIMNEAESRIETWPERGKPSWRTFCHDSVAIRMIALCESLQPKLVLVNYPHHSYLGNIAQAMGAHFVLDTHDRATVRETMLHRLAARFGADPFTADDPELFDLTTYVYDGGAETAEEDRFVASADKILAISERDADFYESRLGARVHYIPMIGEPATFLAKGEAALFIGTANPLNRLAAAFLVKVVLPAVRTRHPEFTLRMVGDVCRDVPDAPGLLKLGFVEDTTKLYAESGMALVPVFYSTGQNIKIVEAMAAGLPVVTFKNVMGRCHLQHLESGYLAKDTNDFVQGVLQLIEDPLARRRMGIAAMETVARFHSPGAVGQRFSTILSGLN